jgi:hypothetical protein
MAAEATTLVDAGTCRWCPHGQWSHKRGKGGCRELDCICDKYTPPKDEPAAAPVPGEVVDGPAVPGPSECLGEPEPAQPADVELPPADPEPSRGELLARMTRESIDLGTYDLAVPADEPVKAEPDRTGQVIRDVGQAIAADRDEIRRLRIQLRAADGTIARQKRELAQARRERDGMRVQRDQAYGRVEEQDVQLGRIRAALGPDLDADADLAEAVGGLRYEANRLEALADAQRAAHLETATAMAAAEQRVDELSTDLAGAHAALTRADGEAEEAQRRAQARANRLERQLAGAKAGRQHAQQTLSEAIQAGTEAATRVLWRYDAEQCQDCGFRSTVPVVHEHPLEPVTVLVVRREVAG